ncbi:hypothetical protein [Flavobacterium terrisoli]|uniref:hypothetical protein n=1 Tax=Flavobacterium terrisoli TaxID=3242195 RepID=UPI002543D60C|nr:hypothetical protein [Flavobacterium buctense]
MRKLPILTISLLIALTIFSCKNTEEQETPIDEVVAADTISAEKPNELKGIVFREISEIPQLKDYEDQAGTIISEKDSLGNYKYAIGQYGNDKNFLIILEELVKEAGNPKSKFKILDTLNIPKLNPDEFLTFATCRLNEVYDNEIIAIVKSIGSDDVETYDQIIKAWRADTKTQKIIPIEDVKGIDCVNESY